MKIQDATVLITGANRGIGLAFARAALARGARKVYAAARDPESITLSGVVPIKLDVTSAEDIAAAARRCDDVTVLINNAGVAKSGGFLADGSIESARSQIETNFFGPLQLTRAFASTLAKNGGGAVVNVLSIASWVSSPQLAIYSASKAAAWALTNGLRHELRGQGTQVLGMHVGFVDTDLTKGLDIPKVAPDVVAAGTLDALEAGADEVLVDEAARQVKAGLNAEPSNYLGRPKPSA
jgi:NAD(P)-dependent dehydrogenase (short-subunit alcohol dehydrogenase family)